jgi:outer membrane protein assembly factor BamB
MGKKISRNRKLLYVFVGMSLLFGAVFGATPNKSDWASGNWTHFLTINQGDLSANGQSASSARPAVAASSNSAVSGGDWLSFIFNFKNSREQSVSTITSSNVNSLKEVWFVNTGSVTGTPIVSNGSVYFGDYNGNVYSVAVSTGHINWHDSLGSSISSTLAISNGELILGYGPNGVTNVVALNPANGNIIWNTVLGSTTRGIWASPTVFGGQVFIGTSGSNAQGAENNATWIGKIYALNLKTGAKDWIDTVGGPAGGGGVTGSVVYEMASGSLYFATGNPYTNNGGIKWSYSVVDLNATNGKLNWFSPIYNSLAAGDDKDFLSTPNLFSVKVKGVTYPAIGVGNKNGYYYVFNRANGNLIEKLYVGTNNGIGGVAGLAGYYYPRNNFSNPEIYIPTYKNGAPDFTNSKICCGTLAAYLPAGNRLAWSFNASANLIGSVALIPGAVVFGDIKGDVYALSLTSGKTLWHTSIAAPIFGGVSVAEGHLFVPTAFNGNNSTLGVYAYST